MTLHDIELGVTVADKPYPMATRGGTVVDVGYDANGEKFVLVLDERLRRHQVSAYQGDRGRTIRTAGLRRMAVSEIGDVIEVNPTALIPTFMMAGVAALAELVAGIERHRGNALSEDERALLDVGIACLREHPDRIVAELAEEREAARGGRR